MDTGSFYSIRESKRWGWDVSECHDIPFHFATILPRSSESFRNTGRVRKLGTNILPNLR